MSPRAIVIYTVVVLVGLVLLGVINSGSSWEF
jgi:hypothetical protein